MKRILFNLVLKVKYKTQDPCINPKICISGIGYKELKVTQLNPSSTALVLNSLKALMRRHLSQVFSSYKYPVQSNANSTNGHFKVIFK